MSDGTPDGTPTGHRPDADRTVLSVPQAAARLGVTPDAVRARLHRGTLAGEKVGGAWRVLLPADEARPPRPDHRPDEPIDRQDDRRASTGARQDADRPADALPVAALVAAKDELIAALRDENAFLRAQLDHSRRELATERERFDVIHREALGRIEALTAGPEPAPASAAAPGAADPAPQASQATHPRRRPWWRFWGA